MNADRADDPATNPGNQALPQGLRLMTIAGVEVRLDGSLLIIFALILMSLAGGLFPLWHPDWGPAKTLLTAAGAAILFLCSVLLHELSHAVVGRRLGIEVRRITLFVFGGMAHLEGEPKTWQAELATAIAGPIASLVLGTAVLGLAQTLSGPIAIDPANPAQALSRLGPVTTLLYWLGPINILLGLFNLIPGFPLDGGRVLRAILWGVTGNLTLATRWAAAMGQAIGWLLTATGFAMILGLRVPVFGTGLVGGLWLALIGWFLNNAALQSYRHRLIEDSLGDLPVSGVMHADYRTVEPDMSVQALVDERLLATSQRVFPVVDGQGLRGIVCLEDVRRLDRDQWPWQPVAAIMTPLERLHVIGPDAPAAEALDRLARHGVNQLPVVRDGQFLGLVSRQDILTWLVLHRETGPYRAGMAR